MIKNKEVEAGETWQGILRGERRARKIHLPPRGPQEGSESHPRSPKRRPKQAHCNSQESSALAQESFEMAHWIVYTVGAMSVKSACPLAKAFREN